MSNLLCVLCVHVSASIVATEQLGDHSGDETHRLLFGISNCPDCYAFVVCLDGSVNGVSNSDIVRFIWETAHSPLQ